LFRRRLNGIFALERDRFGRFVLIATQETAWKLKMAGKVFEAWQGNVENGGGGSLRID